MSRSAVYVTRKFPPSIGGMETLAAAVWRVLKSANPDARLIANGRSNAALLYWVPVAVVKLGWSLLRGRVSFVLCGDALMFMVLRPLLALTRTPCGTLVMGLDLTYEHPWYQRLVRHSLPKAPLVLAISEATASEARARGGRPEQTVVLPLGVNGHPVTMEERSAAGSELRRWCGLDDQAVLLVTLGRVVRRKGAAWFVEHVMPQLPADVHYVVAGDGEDMPRLREVAAACPVADRVHLVGTVTPEQRELLLRGADLFVQPNIQVRGDMEGFGLVIAEAAVRGTPVVAAALEGITDAVQDDVTGVLLPSGDVAAWVEEITRLSQDAELRRSLGDRFGAAAAARYGEHVMGEALIELLRNRATPALR